MPLLSGRVSSVDDKCGIGHLCGFSKIVLKTGSMALIQPSETVGIKRRAEILRSDGGGQEIRKSTVWIGRREGVASK